MKFTKLLLLGALLGVSAVQGASVYDAPFKAGAWKAENWDMVKSWRWDYAGKWLQKSDHLVNVVPADATDVQMLGQRAGETYTSMLLKDTFSGKVTVSCTMSFDYRMAPGIIIAPEPVKNAKGQLEHREHFEIVIYDEGVNVWHHFFVNGKQQWTLTAFLRAKLKAKTPYELKVEVAQTHRGPRMTLSCDGHTFGYLERNLPKTFRVGVVASEGVNRMYDFKVEK